MIVDMADESSFIGALDTGSEQRVFKKHASDLMDLFHAGIYIDLETPGP